MARSNFHQLWDTAVKEADSMIETAQANRVGLCVVHNELFLPIIMKARAMINEKMIGDVMEMTIKDTMPRDHVLATDKEHWCHQLPGGVFGEMLAHPIYLALAFLGGLEPVAVHSRKTSSRDWLVADELRVIMENKNSVVTLISSINTSEDTMAIDFLGSKKSLYVDPWGSVMVKYGAGRKNHLSRGWGNIGRGLQEASGTVMAAFNIMSGRHHSGHYTLIKRFISSLRSGTEPPVTVAEAREVVRLYEAITKQISTQTKPQT